LINNGTNVKGSAPYRTGQYSIFTIYIQPAIKFSRPYSNTFPYI